MNCPACIKDMEKFEHFEVEIDRCRYCGGIWLDGNELSLFLSKGIIPINLLTSYCLDIRKAKVQEGKRECPRCEGTAMLEVVSHKGINVDYCNTCRGFWFDRGELLKILEKYRKEVREEAKKIEDSVVIQEIDKDGKEIIRIEDESLSVEMKPISAGEDLTLKDQDNPLAKELLSVGSKETLAGVIPPELIKVEEKTLKDRVKEQLEKQAAERKKLKMNAPADIETKPAVRVLEESMATEEGRDSIIKIILKFLVDLLSVFMLKPKEEENQNNN